ncbi:hypothetical protein BJY00DRAFT_311565 [Aspergillus carlsbadensis]|nr:hypothetical protein BJY00DRAFT_311565 [Aspergillus carlsbadensis]
MDPVPPASRNGFEYYYNDFYVVIPPYNRHRRCTVPELQDLFSSPGLPPSRISLRTGGTAMMRLLDAVRLGELEVPDYLVKLEENLRRTTIDQILLKQTAKHSQELKTMTIGSGLVVQPLTFSDTKGYYTVTKAGPRAEPYGTKKRTEGDTKYTSKHDVPGPAELELQD